ncbi:hypothetical protein LOAG_07274 [Loa loa]|uniref:Uncharacterized protein n=1 Tax=Loa loa TaxID=7209 RepID=A0A1S0TW57_LOALO|nr:hypothetical protein LOAG_07274 [Loa loa]EFO21212.1 hypothetical protein LOAG_07274 [Loa loa]
MKNRKTKEIIGKKICRIEKTNPKKCMEIFSRSKPDSEMLYVEKRIKILTVPTTRDSKGRLTTQASSSKKCMSYTTSTGDFGERFPDRESIPKNVSDTQISQRTANS